MPKKDTVLTDGWVMVPREPTEEMVMGYLTANKKRALSSVQAWGVSNPKQNFKAGYYAMLAVAPQSVQPASVASERLMKFRIDSLSAANGGMYLHAIGTYDCDQMLPYKVGALVNVTLATAPQSAQPSSMVESPLLGKYGDVLTPFVTMMEHELHANAGKGDRPGWLSMDCKTVLLEIYYHLSKLQKSMKNNDAAGIVEYAADVANMSMMAVDVCGLLAAAPQPAKENSDV